MQLLLLFVGLVPSFIWLIFYLQEDARYPEPRRLIFTVFFVGALSTFAALYFQVNFNNYLDQIGVYPYSFPSLFILASIEEVIKFIAVYLVIRKNTDFDEPLDAMIYMIVAALGFAAVENIGAISDQFGQSAIWGDALQIAIFRFVGATLLHAIASGFIGYYWALGILNGRAMQFILKGIGISILLHAIFNYFILRVGPTIYPIALLVIAAFFLLHDFERIKKEEHI